MKILLPVLVVLLLTSCSTPQKDKNITGALDSLFTKEFPDGEPGGAVLVMKGEKIVFKKGYGLADLSGSKVNTKTLFNLGSISKTFVANAILMLEAEGKLSVEDSMDKYFPHFKNKQIAKTVKIKHLLTHTSGLPDNRQVTKDPDFYLTALDDGNWRPVTQTDSLVFDPGTRYQYSNPAYNGLALIIESVTGVKWQHYVAKNIFEPAGMTSSTITDGPHPETGVAHAYVNQGGDWTELDYGEEPTFPAAGNGGVWSSVEELAKYELAMQRNTFLPDSIVTRSRSVTSWQNWQDENPPFTGWSWFIDQTEDGIKTVGHTGSQGGFLANYVTIPDKDIFFTILYNTPREMEEHTNFIMRWLAENHWLSKAQPAP